MSITMDRLTKIIDFLEEINKAKDIYRATYATEDRHENDAEHSWHMAMFALLLHKELRTEVNIPRVVEMILVHDLVEIYAGDTYVFGAGSDQREREEDAAERLFSKLPPDLQKNIRGLWDEFEAQQTEESRFARSLDCLQAFSQNVLTKGRVWREKGISEQMSRERNEKAMYDPALKAIFEALYARAKPLWPESRPEEKTF